MNNFNMSYLTSVNTSSDNLGEEMIVKLSISVSVQKEMTSVNTSSDNLGEEMIVKLSISVSVQKEMIIKTDNQMEMRNMLRE